MKKVDPFLFVLLAFGGAGWLYVVLGSHILAVLLELLSR